jgi:phosphomannomutase
MPKPKHVFFDLDGTLTRSRSLMAEVHRPIFDALCAAKDVVVVTGGQVSQIRKQIPPIFNNRYYILSQYGNHAVDRDGTVLWSEQFTPEQKQGVLDLIRVIHDELRLQVQDENDLVEDRGSQISYSLIGHHEDTEKKEAFDPGAKKRLDILARHAEKVERLRALGADVRPGGTTTFDFTIAGKHKGFNIIRLLEHQGWHKGDSLYIGDAHFNGGNHETVIGVIPTHGVKDYNETFTFIQTDLL